MKKYKNLKLEIEKAEDVILTSDGFETEDDDFGEGSGSGTETPIIPTGTNLAEIFNL